jgi:UDP-2,4-diacetamido-2,4,6-trideoxy-beta-L-altropyranose hydrolase
MRCLTLAEALTRAGAVCAFAATPQAAALLDIFAGPAIARLPVDAGEADVVAAEAARAATAWNADAAVIDHYGFAPEHEAVVGAAVRRTLVLDDLRRPHACDLVLDSNLGRTAADYPGLSTLAGTAFALVRPAFAALREATLLRRRGGGPVRRILVSLGLTDVGGITGKVVASLLAARGDAVLDVVVGGSAPSLPALRALAAAEAGIALHVDTRDMAGLTAAADLAVGAGGSSVWERCCLGLPGVLVVLADNQRPNAVALEGAGASVALDVDDTDFDDRLRAAVTALVASPAERRRLGEASAALCDGQGADRVAARLLALLG